MTITPHALITGASSGLGKCLAWECASRGYPLVLVALPETGLCRVKMELELRFDAVVYLIEADLTDENGPQQVIDFCNQQNLSVNVLINNAGVGLESSFESIPISFCTTLLQLNTLAVVKMTRLFLPMLKTHSTSYILNVSSLASYTPMPFKGIYAASKAFVNSFSCSLRTELKGSGISVSVLCPGGIPTNELVKSRIKNHGWIARAGMINPEKLSSIAIREMLNRKQVIVPGRINRISKFFMQIVPTVWQQSILYRKYARKINMQIT